VAPSRTGRKTVAGHFDPAVSRQLRTLALERDTSLQELLREAINDLFVKYKKAPLA
jgi:predicted transcriptional regulator